MNKTSKRIGVIDIGSNSVRFVVFEGNFWTLKYFYNEKVICGLGKGLNLSGKLNPQGKLRALNALCRFKILIERMKINNLSVVATAAIREASDGKSFCQKIQNDFNINVQIISGEEEARLSAKGILLSTPNATGLVCDLGGSSLEFAELDQGKIKTVCTSKLGPLSILDQPYSHDDFIKLTLKKVAKNFKPCYKKIYLIGGSFRAIAKFHIKKTNYPLPIIHNLRLPISDLCKTLPIIKKSTKLERQRIASTSQNRAELLPIATDVLSHILNQFGSEIVSFSSYGLREGLFYESLQTQEKNNSIIKICRKIEAKKSRFPGFGDLLYKWILPLFPKINNTDKHLIHITCLLHDTHWNIHPDSRAEICFNSMIHSNFGTLSHHDRIYIASALFYRYNKKITLNNHIRIFNILNSKDKLQVESLGKAIHFGTIILGSQEKNLGQIRLGISKITLTLSKQNLNILGEIGQKSFKSMAESFMCKAIIEEKL